MLLEEAGRRPHRGLLGPLDLAHRQVVDPGAAAQQGQLLPRDRQRLRVGRDLLRVDRIRLEPGARVGLLVADALELRLRVAHLDLEPLAGARFAGDGSDRLDRMGLLFDLERRLVAQLRQPLRRLASHEPLQLPGQHVDPGDMVLFEAEQLPLAHRVTEQVGAQGRAALHIEMRARI